MSSGALVAFFQYLALAGSALTAFKLYSSGLYSRYRIFFWYFLFRIPNSIWPLILDVRSDFYRTVWLLMSPVVWVFYVGVVLELYRLVLERHKGIYSLGRWTMYAALALSVTISGLTLLPRIRPAMPIVNKEFAFELAAERGIIFSLVLFILFILLFLSRYPVRLSRNVVAHVTLYSVYFLTSTVALLLRSLFGMQIARPVNVALSGISSLCVLGWFFLLNPKGEEVKTNLPHFSPEHEKRLLAQLDALNATLLKVPRD